MINKLKIRVIIFTFSLFTINHSTWAMLGTKCTEQAGSGVIRCGNGCHGCRVAVSEPNQAKKQTFSMELLNLKPNVNLQNSVAATQSAITITQADFQNLAAVGNTNLSFGDSNSPITMNVGQASSLAQIWTLPANLYEIFDYGQREDFIAPASSPFTLPAGTTHVMKSSVETAEGLEADLYQNFKITASTVDYLGSDFDYIVAPDDDFSAEPDFKFTDVPLSYTDSYSSTVEKFNPVVNGALYKEVGNAVVDGWGTIATPDGTYNCLRIKYNVNKFKRNLITDSYISDGSEVRYQWISSNGFSFTATVVSENMITHVATLDNCLLTKIVATNTLSEQTDVKLNNNSKGVTINDDDDEADPSAILDIKSNNKGVLIPRVTQVNRPSNPADGLIIYQVDGTKGLYVYIKGTGWLKLATN